MDRAYSLLEVKEVQEDRRILTGVATTPSPDRVGDIVEPLGVKFSNPMPLLHHHQKTQPVGNVTFKRPTKDGITFEARLPLIKEPGVLKDRIDLAWAEIKAGLVKGVSIGFRGIDMELLDTGGIRFKETEVLELSLVTVPANAECTIETIKSFDTGAPAQPKEREGSPSSGGSSPRVVGTKQKQPITKEKKVMAQTTAEKISAFEASRVAKSARMEAIMDEAGDETLDESQTEEYDTLDAEVKKIDEHLVRLNQLARAQSQKAKPASGETFKDGAESRSGEPVRVSVKQPQLPKGIAFARYAKCLALSSKLYRDPLKIAQEIYPNHEDLHQTLKTAVVAANTSTAAFAGALVGNETTVFADFAEFLRPLAITGRIPNLRRVPFRTRLISQTASGSANWVGEGQPKAMQNFTFATTTLIPYKVASITAATMELLRDSSPAAETILRDQLAQCIAAKIDTDFLDPQKGLDVPVVGSPASISNNITAISSSGRDADSVRTDLVAMFSSYITNNNKASTAVWIMSAVSALQLSLMTNALGQPEFPELALGGNGQTGFVEGKLRGIPVITSEYLGYTFDSPVSGRDVFLVNAEDIYYADDGEVDVKMSAEASLQLDDAPTNASATSVTATSMVSMFQTNSVAFLAEKTVSWKRRRTEGVIWLQQVEWGENADSATQP